MLVEKLKRDHHYILPLILGYLNLRELILLSKVNRKLYIVTGDISLLKTFMSGNLPLGRRWARESEGGYRYKIDHLEEYKDCGEVGTGQEFDIIIDKKCMKV